MKLIIDIDNDYFEIIKYRVENGDDYKPYTLIANGIPYEKRTQNKLANEVWKLYEKHHSHLATHVLEFGEELADLLGKYNEGGAV